MRSEVACCTHTAMRCVGCRMWDWPAIRAGTDHGTTQCHRLWASVVNTLVRLRRRGLGNAGRVVGAPAKVDKLRW
ncbi:hypothetical protein VTJ04DRAFT_8574 [Mycothermus thermophilus]|uniref:uncharacterized protein n=1 Tax=Humicola insolens TaxID=85995 RepID=UPI00374412D5